MKKRRRKKRNMTNKRWSKRIKRNRRNCRREQNGNVEMLKDYEEEEDGRTGEEGK